MSFEWAHLQNLFLQEGSPYVSTHITAAQGGGPALGALGNGVQSQNQYNPLLDRASTHNSRVDDSAY